MRCARPRLRDHGNEDARGASVTVNRPKTRGFGGRRSGGRRWSNACFCRSELGDGDARAACSMAVGAAATSCGKSWFSR